MSDPLYDKIIAGLGGLTDREKFEACAADLLRKIYPRLVPIPGGSDAGYDGKALQEDGESIQLVCTTAEDVIGNLTGSLEEAKKRGRKSNAVLLATSRPLSPTQKQNLQGRAAKFGKTLYPVYDQVPIANLLYHDSRWRKELLNLPGNPPALSRLPANHRPTFELSPLGRAKELAAVAAANGDLVVVGQPGSGKTHLLTHLACQSEGLFVVSADRAALADGIRDQQPKWVVVDDAFSRLDELIALRQLRTDMTADFRIVASCWPGQQDGVASHLNVTSHSPVELEPLPIKVIKEIVTAMRIVGPDHIVHEILHQSAGKPGLTVTLCQICWQRGTKELFTAEALTRDVKQSLTALAGEDAVGLLAHYALGGDAGLTIEAAAQVTSMPPLVVARLTEKMGAAGVLEVRREHRLTVEPARLRQALVRDFFCKPPIALDWRRLIDTMPDRADTVDTLIIAGLLEGTIDDQALQKEIAGLRTSLRIGALCEHYARLGRSQSHWVLVEFPEHIEKAAAPLLAHTPTEAIPALLRSGLDHQHLIRQDRDELATLRKWIDEKANTPLTVARREQLLVALEQMHADLQDTPTLLAGLRHVLAIEFEWMTQPPGEPAMLTLEHGFVAPSVLQNIATFWPRALRLLRGLSTTTALRLPQVIADWVNPRARGPGQLRPEFVATCQQQARIMVADLAKAYAGNWVVLHSFHWMAQRVGHTLPASPGLAGILFPPRALGRNEELSRAQQAAIEKLAIEWDQRGPEPALLEDWLKTYREATAASINYPNLSRDVATLVAQRTARAGAWLEALVVREAPAHIVGPFAERCCAQSDEQLQQFVGRYLNHPIYGGLAADYLFRFVPLTADVWRTAKPVIEKYAKSAGTCVLLNAVPDATILALLTEFGAEMAGEVAAHLWSAKPKGDIPDTLVPAWRAALVHCVEDEYQLEEIARTHPDLACAWLKHRVNQTWEEVVAGGGGYDSYHYLPMVIAALSQDQRRDVIDHFDSKNHHGRVLAQLVGDDIELFRHALSRPETARLAMSCLGSPGDPPDRWIQRAILLLEAGRSEEDIFWASTPIVGGSEPWSQLHAKSLEHFRPLLTHADQRIRRIGESAVASITPMIEEALKNERIAAVKGLII